MPDELPVVPAVTPIAAPAVVVPPVVTASPVAVPVISAPVAPTAVPTGEPPPAGQPEPTWLETTIKARADVELSGLSEAQRAAVSAVAGEDSARILSTIDALKPTWAVAAPVAAVTPVVAAVVPQVAVSVVAPATTSPPPVAPGGAAGSPPDRKSEYQALKAKSSVAAAAYLNRYESEIYPRA